MKGRKEVKRNWYGWLVFGLLMNPFDGRGQQTFKVGKEFDSIQSINYQQLKEKASPKSEAPIFKLSLQGPIALQSPSHTETQPFGPNYLHPATLPWSTECLPFFCRIEHNLGKKLVLPVKFRLGSVQYVDWLEGKISSY